MLAESGLDKSDAKTMKCESCLDGSSLGFRYPGAGFTLPYFDQDGKPTKFFRFRYVEDVTRDGFDTITKQKQIRYVQPANISPQVYWAPQAPWKKILADKDQPLFITEGEKKAACASKNLIATIGLGGVWSFKSAHANVSLLPELAKIKWEGRRVYVVYDSDAVSNRNVLMAEAELARQLVERGASVYIVRLPDSMDKKVGLDDFIVAEGAEAFNVLVDEEAEEFTNSEALHELNTKVTLILSPTAIWDNERRRLISPSNFLNTTHHNLKYTIRVTHGEVEKMVEKRTAKEWMAWSGRAVCDTLEYEPGDEEYTINKKGLRAMNAWDGWKCEPKPGNLKPWTNLMDYLFEGVDPSHRQWFERWLAYPLQHPGAKMLSAVVLWGTQQGTGKTFVAHIMKEIYGDNFGEIGMDDIYNSFNAWGVNKQFVLGEEIAGGENKKVLSDRLKKLITQPDILVNTKFIQQYTIRDCINYFFTSNHPDAFYLEDTDRRFFIHEFRGAPKSGAWYAEIDKWKLNGGPAALFDYLLHLDLGEFNPKSAPPETKAKIDMRDESRTEVETWVAKLKSNPGEVLLCAGASLDWTVATTRDLYTLFDPDDRRRQITAFSHALRRSQLPLYNEGRQVRVNRVTSKIWLLKEGLDKLNTAKVAELYLKEHGNGDRKF
jgi:hypothetical protein